MIHEEFMTEPREDLTSSEKFWRAFAIAAAVNLVSFAAFGLYLSHVATI